MDELVKRLRNEAETERYLLPHSDNGTAVLLDEAADAIEQLSAVNERQLLEIAVLSKPRWIPVTERLPDYPGRFMCYYKYETDNEVGYCIDWGRYDPDDGWYASGVTHWQKVPEPPKEE